MKRPIWFSCEALWLEVPDMVKQGIASGIPVSTEGGCHLYYSPQLLAAGLIAAVQRSGLQKVSAGTADLNELAKAAGVSSSSGMAALPSIPVDSFNRVVWNDVRQVPNPWGTRSALGDNEVPLGTPLPVAATVTGLLTGTAQATGQNVVSPLQVAMVAGQTAGKGWVGGLLIGKALGALAGLDDATQVKLQKMGLWGGLLTGAVKGLLGSS